MNKQEELEEAIIIAADRISKNCSHPKDAWVTGFGQVIEDGKLTEYGEEWAKTLVDRINE